MPKTGYRSITVNQSIYDKIKKVYEMNKEKYHTMGIKSFAAYTTYMIKQEMIKQEALKTHAPPLEILHVYENPYLNTTFEMTIRDDQIKKIVKVAIYSHNVFCRHCRSVDCQHVGMAYSDHRIYDTLEAEK